ncbi:hypothetical protein ISF6_0335 [Piscinibacter sakaiensis]|uniref:Uncharacterized protein n=1 Tax=Piscinibacter sakaiensis TaxID=1547922 RepID=A0A0K8NWS1_PISS1|nr:hypothetical protein ISF6_0335 [Piscinibacter sakaiensis]
MHQYAGGPGQGRGRGLGQRIHHARRAGRSPGAGRRQGSEAGAWGSGREGIKRTTPGKRGDDRRITPRCKSTLGGPGAAIPGEGRGAGPLDRLPVVQAPPETTKPRRAGASCPRGRGGIWSG